MNKRNLFALWGGLFVICAGLGFIPAPSRAMQILMTLLSIAFFVPGALLLYLAKLSHDRDLALLIRSLCASSLVLTVVLIVANFLSALGSATLGNILNCVLTIVSAPMICSGYWALSLFLWACLMISAIKLSKNEKNP